MKKKTNANDAVAAKERRHGPQKEKVQLTLRIDRDLMEQAYAMIKDTNQRITDVVERGLVLAMQEEDALPKVMSKVRFLVANCTKEQQEKVLLFLSFLILEKIAPLTPVERLVHRQILEYLPLLQKWRNETMHHFSAYGKNLEDAAQKLGS